MIVYNQAFDFYHSIYRMIRILKHIQRHKPIEVDRLRIFDFYLLFPEQVHSISLKKDEKSIRELRANFLKKKNPYNQVFDNKKLFERLRPYQMTALHCLASYGLINKDLLSENRVAIASNNLLQTYYEKFEELNRTEQNVIALMTLYFTDMSLFGTDGLKSRTKLMESRYDI